MNRRRFLLDATCASIGSTLVWTACKKDVVSVGSVAPSQQAVVPVTPQPALNGRALETLGAVCARLIPTDQDPGAQEAGVVDYIADQLLRPPVSGFRRQFQSAMVYLDRISRTRGARFVALTGEQQDDVLRQFQSQPFGRYHGDNFMRVLLALTLEGFLGDPVYGGNKNGSGWKFIGFEPIVPRSPRPYRGKGRA